MWSLHWRNPVGMSVHSSAARVRYPSVRPSVRPSVCPSIHSILSFSIYLRVSSPGQIIYLWVTNFALFSYILSFHIPTFAFVSQQSTSQIKPKPVSHSGWEISIVLGNKGIGTPHYESQRLENFQNKMGFKGLQLGQFECPRHWIPCVSLRLGDFHCPGE